MRRLITVEQAQEQLLETALDLYRTVDRLHRCREELAISGAAVCAGCEDVGAAVAPLALEAALAEELLAGAEALDGVADGLRRACRLTPASLAEEWRREGLR